MPTARIYVGDGVVKVQSPYHEGFVADLRRLLPEDERAWQRPYWVAEARHYGPLLRLVKTYFDVSVTELPTPLNPRRINVEYLGRCKPSVGDTTADEIASVMVDGAWQYKVTATVLKEYFTSRSGGENSRFALLGVSMDCSPEELKKAYYRAARTWHPDVNHDEDAEENFVKVQRAYEELQAPRFREKYAKGLKLQADVQSLYRHTTKKKGKGYQPPCNCGIFTVDVEGGLKKFFTHIYNVEDETNENGQVRTAYFKYNKRATNEKDRYTLVTEWTDKLWTIS